MADALTFVFRPQEFLNGLTEIEQKQVPQAAVWGLNDTAFDVLKHIQTNMDVVFDRPTRFTKNAFMVWRANKSTLTATVKERPSVSARHFLKVQEDGGARGQTGLEKMISASLGSSVAGVAITPAQGARLNSFGNWSPGEREKIVAAVKGARGGTKITGKSRGGYFVAKPNGKLSKGVWKRSGKTKITKVAHFTDAAPTYSKRLGFFDGAETVFDERFPERFREAFAKAMATRRR